MLVLIKMEMPTNCYDNCPFFAQIYCGEDHGIVNYCCLENWKQSRTPTPFSVEEAKHGRQDFCPLVPVPEHGDLIDKKTVSDNLANVLNKKNPPFSYPDWNDAIVAMLTAPTIIPADPTEVGE